MYKVISSAIGGLTGAVALNVLHQTVKAMSPNAPRVDVVGEEALTKGMESIGLTPPTGDALFIATLAGDVISNALYYSAIGIGKNKGIVLRGAGYGLAAGIGALTLTKPMGLSDAPVTKTNTTKLLTIAWYVFGGLVAGYSMKALRK